MSSGFTISKEDGKFIYHIDTAIYSKEAIVAALYRFAGRYYIYQQTEQDSPNIIAVTFEAKSSDSAAEDIIEKDLKSLSVALIDEQVRYNINTRCGHIRDLIVEEAFKPLNGK